MENVGEIEAQLSRGSIVAIKGLGGFSSGD
jgi:hydrogenase maturation factor HypF (carbamoyltransferase family)